jgi:hypothetical protein
MVAPLAVHVETSPLRGAFAFGRGRIAPGQNLAVTEDHALHPPRPRVQRRPICGSSIASVSSRSFRPLAGTASHLRPARIRRGPRRREHTSLWESSGFSMLARNIYPEFQLFGHPQFHFLQLVRISYASKISVCVSVASGMRQTHFKLGAREVALSNISQRTPRRPGVFRVFCLDALRRTNPLNSVEKMR